MHMTRHVGTQLFGTLLIAGAWLVTPSIANAQGGGRGVAVFAAGTAHTEILNVEPMGNVPTIAKAPFTADATTEFTQILSDGNRIDRRFTTSLARDGRGRTRSEQDVAMVGPLFVLQSGVSWTTGTAAGRPQKDSEPPRFTVITDPVEGVTYTLDERLKQARRSGYKQTVALHAFESAKLGAAAARLRTRASGVAATGGDAPVVESLGTRQIEGVAAEGTRSTTTIPAGQIGNLNPIQLVTERWFSKELQMAVLLTRRDPRSGDTVYRLTNIVRAEPPPDLFTVPADYRVVEPIKLKSEHDPTLQLELNKLHEWHRGGQQ
jgi:hypothetical protein